MTSKPTCILITGMPHSGSRLPVHMLDKHPDVTTAITSLTTQGEFVPLRDLFFKCIDAMPIHTNDYRIDPDEFNFVLDSYLLGMDTSKPFCVIKLPYYPLVALDLFVRYFEGNVRFLFTRRPAEQILRSFTSRGEDTLFFDNNRPETVRQIKKVSVDERPRFLVKVDPEAIFRAQIQFCEALREEWDAAHPDHAFIVLDVERIGKSRDYVQEILEHIGLSTEHLDTLMSVVETRRLLRRLPTPSTSSPLKTQLRRITPPLLWRWLARAKRQLQ